MVRLEPNAIAHVEKHPRPPLTSDLTGGRRRTRTFDPLIKSQLLYQLSYAPFTNYFNVL
jgi:hypothetical protein